MNKRTPSAKRKRTDDAVTQSGAPANRAAGNGSPVYPGAFQMFPSVMALMDEAIRVRKGYACE